MTRRGSHISGGDVGRTVVGFFAGLLAAAGAVISILSGLCTVSFMGGGGDLALIALVIGAFPFLIGLAMVWGGLAYFRAQPPPTSTRPPPSFTVDPPGDDR